MKDSLSYQTTQTSFKNDRLTELHYIHKINRYHSTIGQNEKKLSVLPWCESNITQYPWQNYKLRTTIKSKLSFWLIFCGNALFTSRYKWKNWYGIKFGGCFSELCIVLSQQNVHSFYRIPRSVLNISVIMLGLYILQGKNQKLLLHILGFYSYNLWNYRFLKYKSTVKILNEMVIKG